MMPEPLAAALKRLDTAMHDCLPPEWWDEIKADLALVAPALALANERVMRQDQMLRYIAYVLAGDEAADPQQAADGAVQALAELDTLRGALVGIRVLADARNEEKRTAETYQDIWTLATFVLKEAPYDA